jgi:hypothetical protein
VPEPLVQPEGAVTSIGVSFIYKPYQVEPRYPLILTVDVLEIQVPAFVLTNESNSLSSVSVYELAPSFIKEIVC